MKSRRDDSSKAAAKAAEEFASRAMEKAEQAIRRAEAQDDEEDNGPAKCFAIFKAEGFGMLEAMSQVNFKIRPVGDRWIDTKGRRSSKWSLSRAFDAL